MWKSGVRELVRRHQFDFESASREIGVESEEIRMEFSRQETSKEAVFDRVLHCLGGPKSVAGESSHIIEKWREQRAIQAAEAATLEKIQAERAEMRLLREQRKALKEEKMPLAEEEKTPIVESQRVDTHFNVEGLDKLLDEIEEHFPDDAQCSDELNSLFTLLDSQATTTENTTTTIRGEHVDNIPQQLAILPPPPQHSVKKEERDVVSAPPGPLSPNPFISTPTTIAAAESGMSKAVSSRSQIYSREVYTGDDVGSEEEEEDDDEAVAAEWRAARQKMRLGIR